MKDTLERMWLGYCEIEDEYQQKGQGTEIMQQAIKQYGAVYFSTDDPTDWNNYYKGHYMRCYLNPEGQKFLASLKRKGVLKNEWATSILGVLGF